MQEFFLTAQDTERSGPDNDTKFDPPEIKHQTPKPDKTVQKEVQKDLDQLLEAFEARGYQTSKGTNTRVIAEIVADFAHKTLKQRAKEFSNLNFWTSNDLGLVTRLAFERYRIYNTRSQPQKFRAPEWTENSYIGEVFHNYGLVRINKQEVQQLATFTIILGKEQFIKQGSVFNLGIPYDVLTAGSICSKSKKPKEPEFLESTMDEQGRFIQLDYVILPDHTGKAQFVALRNFGNSTETVQLTVLGKHEKPKEYIQEVTADGYEITADYIRFVCTELFSKFAKFNLQNLEAFRKYLLLKYQEPLYFKPDTDVNVLLIDLPNEIETLQQYVDANVLPEQGKRYKVSAPETVLLDLHGPEGLKEYVLGKLSPFEEFEGLTQKIDFWIEMFYNERFTVNARERQHLDGAHWHLTEGAGVVKVKPGKLLEGCC